MLHNICYRKWKPSPIRELYRLFRTLKGGQFRLWLAPPTSSPSPKRPTPPWSWRACTTSTSRRSAYIAHLHNGQYVTFAALGDGRGHYRHAAEHTYTPLPPERPPGAKLRAAIDLLLETYPSGEIIECTWTASAARFKARIEAQRQ